MPMVHVENLDRVHGCLAEASGLSDRLAARRHDFAAEVGRWLVRLEEAAKGACPGAVPQLAALRTAVEAAAQGLDVPEVGGHSTRRKAGARRRRRRFARRWGWCPRPSSRSRQGVAARRTSP